ncbi:hypothetical protein EVAR_24361_1 [Eumeta japonica]|uniref:Uncharacterized protein n=1 Tax=Eumeta variegata TaxID=151549 RepID=A0A4C1YBP5_EUMVA|nr:hypothetical protein EVAR_24361_1 [Eumeta japonica]
MVIDYSYVEWDRLREGRPTRHGPRAGAGGPLNLSWAEKSRGDYKWPVTKSAGGVGGRGGRGWGKESRGGRWAAPGAGGAGGALSRPSGPAAAGWVA